MRERTRLYAVDITGAILPFVDVAARLTKPL